MPLGLFLLFVYKCVFLAHFKAVCVYTPWSLHLSRLLLSPAFDWSTWILPIDLDATDFNGRVCLWKCSGTPAGLSHEKRTAISPHAAITDPGWKINFQLLNTSIIYECCFQIRGEHVKDRAMILESFLMNESQVPRNGANSEAKAKLTQTQSEAPLAAV